MLHQGNSEATLDQQTIRMLHVGNIDEIGQAPTLINHRQEDPVLSDSERHTHSPLARQALVGLDRVRHCLGGDPTQIVETIATEDLSGGCRRSDNHSYDRDEIRASRDVDLDDMKWPTGRGAHRGIKLAHTAHIVRERCASSKVLCTSWSRRCGQPTTLTVVDSVWEQWDLVCADPGGCDTLDQLMRAIVWAYVLVAWMIFYAALQPWTTDLPKAAGTAIAAIGSAVIVWISVGIIGSSGSLRTAGVITVVGLIAVWIGRPTFAQRGPVDVDEVNADASPTSSKN